MGNMLLRAVVHHHGRRIKIMKADGTVMKLRSPVCVKEILIDYPNHGIFEAPSGPPLGITRLTRSLLQSAELVGGHLYYLIPLAQPQDEPIDYYNNINGGHFARDGPSLQPRSSAGTASAINSLKKPEEAVDAIDKINRGGGVRIFSSSYSTHGSMVRVKVGIRKEDLTTFLSANNVTQNIVVPPLIERATRQPAVSPWKPRLDTIVETHGPIGDLERCQTKRKLCAT